LVHQEIESAPTRLHGILISGLKDKQLEELRYFCRHPQCDFSGEPMDRLIEPNTKEGREEARQRECISILSALSALAYTTDMAHDGYKESTCCFVQARFLGMETKILFPC
jgi:hypothetical protein